jgi:hypothetical protein
MDQVKLRYMLEQSVKNWSPYLNLLLFKKLGIWQNLLVRINQQVTNALLWVCKNYSKIEQVGTSETTREAISSNFFDFSNYDENKKKHLKNIDKNFLVWFIGFVEGDGSFLARESQRDSQLGSSLNAASTGRAYFQIVQKRDNIKLLYYIKKNLGFGLIGFFEKNGKEYAQWYTSERKHILTLIALLNGNLILEKRQKQFQIWVEKINQYWNLNIPIKKCLCEVSLSHAWLSGFCDADAGFYTNLQNNFKRGKKKDGTNYYAFFCKFYITQDGEITVLKKIQSLVGDTRKIYTFWNKDINGDKIKEYNRLEISKIECIEVLNSYFLKFPLKGQRLIDYLRWARVHGYKQRHVHLSERSATKLARLIQKLETPYWDKSPNLDFQEQISSEIKTIQAFYKSFGTENYLIEANFLKTILKPSPEEENLFNQQDSNKEFKIENKKKKLMI